MSILVQDVVNRMQDYIGNYSTGQENTDQQIRAVDSAVNFLKRSLGLPQDEKLYTFYYTQDNFYYSCPIDFQEAIQLFYDSTSNNYPTLGNRWEYRPWQELSVRTGQSPGIGNYWSHNTFNGSHQLMLVGSNKFSGQLLESFDSNLWTASGDASAAVTDTVIKYQGSASERFTLTYSTGAGTLTSGTVNWNMSTLFAQSGYVNVWVYFTSTAVTNIQLILQSSTGNYYTMTATQNANGQTWQNNTWNKVTFQTASAVATGTPVNTGITTMKLVFNIPNTFGTATNFRVDDLYTTFPDLMDFIYYSNLKTATKTTLTALNDSMPYDWDFIELLALRAAIYILPQLKGDLSLMGIYQQDLMNQIKTYARTWPRKRMENNFMRSRLSR